MVNIRHSPSVVVFVVFAVALVGCRVRESPTAGSSVVVLVDFSKSFAPLSQDQRPLQAISVATAELARQEWQPPVAVLWSRIQTASLVSSPLCGPFQFEQSLIKRDNDESAQIAEKLKNCSDATVRTSTISAEQAPYTDISGAIALAAQQSEGRSAKYLIIISDFIEDLPPGKHAVTVRLNGERVLLLHRTGTEHSPMAVVDHLDRVRGWSEALRRAGASSVVALPLNSITSQRVMRALSSGSSRMGTDVVVLQDLPDSARPAMLRTIAGTLNKGVRDWDSPVTVTWVDMRDEPNPPWQWPPLELTSGLIKTSRASHPTPGFPALINECAEGMQRFYPGAKNGDIAASLRVYASAGALEAKHVILIISSFPDLPKPERDLPADLSGAKVVMLPAPNREDASDESAYLKRVADWHQRLREQHANVCVIPFNGLTSSSLLECIHGH